MYTFPAEARPGSVVVDVVVAGVGGLGLGLGPGLGPGLGLGPALGPFRRPGPSRPGLCRPLPAWTAAGGLTPGHPPHRGGGADGPDPDRVRPCRGGPHASGTGLRAVAAGRCRRTAARPPRSAAAIPGRGVGVVAGAGAGAGAGACPERRLGAIVGRCRCPRHGIRGRPAGLRRDGRDATAGVVPWVVVVVVVAAAAGAGAGPGRAVAAAAPAPPARTIAGAGRPAGGIVVAEETPAGGEERATAARGADTGTGEPLLRLHPLLHGTDRLMVQALKADDDLPLTTRRRRARSRTREQPTNSARWSSRRKSRR
ncbi:uncharacterized protein P884DRAFT_263334 [Thermothelomyces heterothallicus CBS 202.75]|uniref:uncharacterized protein n=1 Tax=Thermothelomyces heterothallicus CBS 202.75 TaxID=1149848 RepID=UPI003743C43E